MELIQIIESTVFIFSLGLLVLLIMSYLLFKVKNRDAGAPVYNNTETAQSGIIYEKPAAEEAVERNTGSRCSDRFIVVNETMNQSHQGKSIHRRYETNPRFYIYKPGQNKIITNLQLSRIKH